MIGAPAERPHQPDTNDQVEWDLPLRPHSDPPSVASRPPGHQPDWDRPEGIEFTEVEYEYGPKLGPARLMAYAGGIVAMAVASVWLVVHATNRSPLRTWTWSAPDLSALPAPQVSDQLKRLPGELARVPEELAKVPAETKRLLGRATEAVTPPPSAAKPPAPAPTAAKPPAPAPSVASPPAPTSSIAKPPSPSPSLAKPSVPAPTAARTPEPGPAPAASARRDDLPELPPKPAVPPFAARRVTAPPPVVGRPAPASIPTPPSVAKAPPPVVTPPVAKATAPEAPRTATATSKPTTAPPPRPAPSTRPLVPLTTSANPTPTQRAAAAAAAAAPAPAPDPAPTPRAAAENAVRPSPASPAPADVSPSPSTPAASATAAAGTVAAAGAPTPEAPSESSSAAAPASSAAPRSALVEADAAIRNVLGRYRTAFNVLDARAASDVWPTVDQRTLNRAFDQLAEQNVSFDNCAIDVKGVLAQAHCTGTIRFVPKIGSRSAQVEPRRWDFTLRKAYSGWVIHEVRAR